MIQFPSKKIKMRRGEIFGVGGGVVGRWLRRGFWGNRQKWQADRRQERPGTPYRVDWHGTHTQTTQSHTAKNIETRVSRYGVQLVGIYNSWERPEKKLKSEEALQTRRCKHRDIDRCRSWYKTSILMIDHTQWNHRVMSQSLPINASVVASQSFHAQGQ